MMKQGRYIGRVNEQSISSRCLWPTAFDVSHMKAKLLDFLNVFWSHFSTTFSSWKVTKARSTFIAFASGSSRKKVSNFSPKIAPGSRPRTRGSASTATTKSSFRATTSRRWVWWNTCTRIRLGEGCVCPCDFKSLFYVNVKNGPSRPLFVYFRLFHKTQF